MWCGPFHPCERIAIDNARNMEHPVRIEMTCSGLVALLTNHYTIENAHLSWTYSQEYRAGSENRTHQQ